jgi:thiamine pyrophosphate-dependent acetolactate synthase large subunit-like protein
MAIVTGSQILARALRKQDVDTMFYLMGGPMLAAESACITEGIRAIDVRHEQAAAMMAHAWARVTNRIAVCMAASGPGTTNLVTGVGNAWADAAPLLAIGGAAPLITSGRGIFQECDQLSLFKPITKWADRCLDVKRIPDMVATALRQAQSGRPGPVYLDMPGDVLYKEIEEDLIRYPEPGTSMSRARPKGDPEAVRAGIRLLTESKRPVLVSGSGIIWSQASDALRRFVELAGLPFYTTPQGRGVIPDDHDLSFLAARNTAFREADLIIVVATRMNYVSGHFTPPRFAADARLIQVDIEPAEIGLTRSCDVGIVGDAKAILEQLHDEGGGPRLTPGRYAPWVEYLRAVHAEKSAEAEKRMSSDAVPIHPLRLCKEVRDFLARDAYLVVDGQEILNYGRQAIPTFLPGHRLNSGPWGTMGVGLPFGLGVKVAHPDTQVLVLHGDGSFGLNAMELDTAVRHRINVVCVISLNGGWTADPQGIKPGRDLGYTRYDRMAEALGCHAEYVEEPQEIRPALERAFTAGKPAVVNVKTDFRARAQTAKYSVYTT